MTIHDEKLCPCCSGNTYKQCCAPLHQGAAAANALQLMRARFSAYALDIPDYIIKTTHPASNHFSENRSSWKKELSQFSKSCTFQRLEVIDFRETPFIAIVTFVVYALQNNRDATFTEQSLFEKFNGQWYYLRGRVFQGRNLSQITQEDLQVLPLAYYGHPILREKANPVVEINDEIHSLVRHMIQTMQAYYGIGLAAPQIKRSIRLFITQAPIEDTKGKMTQGVVEVYINPKFSSPSSSLCEIDEGCLSIPTMRRAIIRPQEIDVEYVNLAGETIKKRLTGWDARTAMHENDHINGVLYIDRLNKKERMQLEPRLNNLKHRIYPD